MFVLEGTTAERTPPVAYLPYLVPSAIIQIYLHRQHHADWRQVAKSELHEFFQLMPGTSIPTFHTESKSSPPADPDFLCTLKLPSIDPRLPEQTCTGRGRNKITAEHYAAEQALDFLRQHGLIAPAVVQKPEKQLASSLMARSVIQHG